ncbi:MAG: hypothetical protein GQ574_05770 [Crocinitomix sp.]|nr:hypothetical protein [Crocinitomix sp.]
MKRQTIYALSISLMLLFASFGNEKPVVFAKEKVTYVWICVTEGSYAYHFDSKCHGLNRCKGERRHVTLEDAVKKYERKICGYED